MTDKADEELTALLDGQIEGLERAGVLNRLASQSHLQERFGALARTRGPLDAGFAAMLAEAPVAKLRAALPPRPRPSARLRIAASIVVAALLAAAFAVAITGGIRTAQEDWTTAVVDYMQLYTAETFAGPMPDAAQQTALVAKVGARLGVRLTPDDLAAPGLAFKTAFLLSYDGDPLGEFVFADAAGAPYLFCVLAEAAGAQAPRRGTRQGFALATWGRGDRRYLVIGASADVVRDWSRMLAGRV